MLARFALVFVVYVVAWPPFVLAASTVIRSEPLHLRSGEQREWRSFPAIAQGPTSSLSFNSRKNTDEYSLILSQRDVKAPWTVTLNDSTLGNLVEDERGMVRILAVPAGTLRDGANHLRIASKPGSFSDDIELRDIRIEDLPVARLQRESTVNVEVAGDRPSLPVRITIVDSRGFLMPVSSLRTDAFEAIRTGVVYTADGKASFGLPTGEYRIYASRGFEYSAPSARIRLLQGQRHSVTLKIRREVDMTGFASCDTHVHTLEWSGHGDASVDERALTAAGEGLDLIVATEHNRFADYSESLRKRRLNSWVTSISGSEVTTPIGHFNIFPIRAGAAHPNPRESDWTKLMNSVTGTDGVRVVVQNHPRDVHSTYRPFDPSHHISSLGENLEGRPFLAHAMEVVNSGAMASDPLQLVRDWLGLLTRGLTVAAIGASDTHTVDFVPIGQARTYIDVTAVSDWRRNTDGVTDQLAAGRNLVSYGLAVDLQQAGPASAKGVPVIVTISGPSWSAAEQVTIYSNGTPAWSRRLAASRKPGKKFTANIQLPPAKNDAALVAVATGPGIVEPFWEVRKPYQPTSDDWTPIVFGASRAVWIDADGNGGRNAPLEHARRLVKQHSSDAGALIRALSSYDESVSRHAFHLFGANGRDATSAAFQGLVLNGSSTVQQAYTQYTRELKMSGR